MLLQSHLKGNCYPLKKQSVQPAHAAFDCKIKHIDPVEFVYHNGIFLYIFSTKLRLLYECNPIAFLIEQAGGLATTGTQRILDVQPESLHQRVPFVVGSPDDVNDYLTFVKKYPWFISGFSKWFYEGPDFFFLQRQESYFWISVWD